MKQGVRSKHSRLRILFAFFAFSIVLVHNASAQGKQDFKIADKLASIQCRDNQLLVLHVSDDAAMGGLRSIEYDFTNNSLSPCTLKGYPNFEVLNKTGRIVRVGRATHGLNMMGDGVKSTPQLVTIEPGKSARFLVHYNAGGAGREKPCPTYGKVRITAPGITRGLVLRESLQLCGGVEVSPVGLSSAEER